MSQAALWTTDPDQFSKQVTHEICLKKIPEIRIVQDRKIGISRKSLDEFSRNPAESSVRENVRWMWNWKKFVRSGIRVGPSVFENSWSWSVMVRFLELF